MALNTDDMMDALRSQDDDSLHLVCVYAWDRSEVERQAGRLEARRVWHRLSAAVAELLVRRQRANELLDDLDDLNDPDGGIGALVG